MNQVNSKAISEILMRQIITPTRDRQRKDEIQLFITMILFGVLGVVLGAILWIN